MVNVSNMVFPKLSTDINIDLVTRQHPRNSRYIVCEDNPNFGSPISHEIEELIDDVKDQVILCLDTAAQAIPISSIYFYYDIKVYSPVPLDNPYIDNVFVIPNCFDLVEYDKRDGLFVTTAEQTIRDMLNHFKGYKLVSGEIFYSSLANYYHNSGCNWNRLERTLYPDELIKLQYYKKGAEEFYLM